MTPLKSDFFAFHKGNPAVYDELCELARALLARGQRRGGIAALWEVMRYNFTLRHPTSDVKFPNNHRAYYARAITLLEPDLSDFFQLCTLRSGEQELTKEELRGFKE